MQKSIQEEHKQLKRTSDKVSKVHGSPTLSFVQCTPGGHTALMVQSVSLPMGKPAAQPDNKLCGNTCGTVSRALITSTVPRKEKGETHNIISLKQVNITLQPAVSTAQAASPEPVAPR